MSPRPAVSANGPALASSGGTLRTGGRRDRRHMMLAVLFLPLLMVVVSLMLPARASAWHDGQYWFFQGYLATPDTVTHQGCGPISCPNLALRHSFSCYSKDMRQIFIRRSDYGWDGFTQYSWDCDDTSAVHWDIHVAAGCQNPNWPPYIFVWVNCRLGNGV